MPTLRKILILTLCFIPCYATLSVAVIIPEDTPKNCKRLLDQIGGIPLRPEGSAIQDPYFKEVDRVAAILKGNDQLNETNEFINPRKWRELTAESGLPGADLPKTVGGRDLPIHDVLKMFEYAGRYSLNLRDIVGGGHARFLLGSSAPEHKKILEQVAKGNGYVAIAITEKEAGSNVRGMQSVSKKVEGGYEISGDKFYNARLGNCSHVIIMTQAPGQEGKTGKISSYILPIDYPGLKVTEIKAGGLKGNSFGGVSFKNLFIPETARIGKDGQSTETFRKHFTYWRTMQISAAIGTARRALEMTSERMKTREVGGKKLASMTHLQQALADHTMKMDAAAVYLERIVKNMEEGKEIDATTMAAGAKGLFIKQAFDAVEFSTTTHGASGYDLENDLMGRLWDLQGLKIADGSSDVMNSEYVKRIYGKDMWNFAFSEGGQ